GKPFEKIVNGGAALEIFEQRSNRHAGALEQPRPADLFGRALQRRALAPIKHGIILEHDLEKWKPVFAQDHARYEHNDASGPSDAVFSILIRRKAQYVKVVSEPEIILIAGPTASGKSALALELAEKLRGVVINADSMQVYRDLRVITARPTPKEEEIGRASCRERV